VRTNDSYGGKPHTPKALLHDMNRAMKRAGARTPKLEKKKAEG
jgi:hypothetical protein